MNEGPSKITGNKGYFRETHLTHVYYFDGKMVSEKFGVVSEHGVFFPPNLKKIWEKLESKGTFTEPLAQAALQLARKPIKNEVEFF
ncbi:MAG: hypothetical protein AAB876_01015 [Patescibacteria group bacterium]